MKVTVEVEVSKEAYELGTGAARIIKAVKEAVADGWQAGEDLPPIIASLFAEMAAVEGIDRIDDEMKEDPAAFAKAVALSLSDVYASVKGPEEPALEPAPEA